MSHKEKHSRERNLELLRLKKVWLMDLLGGLINRVLETQFPGGHHMEKMPHQTLSDHGNRVFEIRFIGPRLSLLNWRC